MTGALAQGKTMPGIFAQRAAENYCTEVQIRTGGTRTTYSGAGRFAWAENED
jgi:hypothetical protein